MPLLKIAIPLVIILTSCQIRDFSGVVTAGDVGRIERFVQFTKGDKIIATFKVELATTDEERQKGLMFRKDLPQNEGMLFVFEDESTRYFWMKNTYIPLDMIFITSTLNIAGIIHSATPLSERTLSIGRPSRYVLEINGGLCEKLGIDENTRAVFINIFN